jgi:hypothetical protein
MFVVGTADLYTVAAYEQRPANWEIPVDPGAAIPPAAGGSSGQERKESALHQAPGKPSRSFFPQGRWSALL